MVKRLAKVGSFDLARKELSDLQKLRDESASKFGPLTDEDEARLAAADYALADAVQGEWPRNLARKFGFQEGTPRVFAWAVTAVEIVLAACLLYTVALIARFLRRRGKYWRLDGRPIDWTVTSILDETQEAAVGAVMDALNVYYNPLFQRLPTSSFLAVPPALLAPRQGAGAGGDEGDAETWVWRNFLRAPDHKSRKYLSIVLEEIDTNKFARHRFRQVKAFDDFNLKLGFIEATPGAIVRGLRRWWQEGWPSVSGAVTIETLQSTKFANVRLIGSVGDLRSDKSGIEQPAKRGQDTTVEDLFSSERTITVYASTQVDQYTDAVALASHRAAFRLLFRLVRPSEPNLAIAASSYRQAVRLLTTAL